MFNSQAQTVIEQSLVKAKWQAEGERQTEAANRLNLYSDDYEDIILDTLKANFSAKNYDRLKLAVNGSQNILKRVVNELSMVYKAEAKRALSAKSDRYEAIKKALDIDTRMRRVNRLTNLLNDIIVKVGVRSGRIVYDIITPDACTITQAEDDPTRITSCTWLRTLVNTPSSSAVEYEYVDDLGWWAILDKDFRIKTELYNPATYPYRDADGAPLMPLVPVHRSHSDSSFWDQDSGRDLYNASVLMGVKMTILDYYIKTASFKQPYVIGADMEAFSDMDVTTILNVKDLDPGVKAEIGTLDLQPQLPAIIEALTYQINSVINNYGISADMWSLSISELSGRALKIKNRALLEQREEQLPTYREAEAAIFELTKVVNNVHASAMKWERIPDDATLDVDFAEIEFPEDPVYELDLAIKKLECGLLSPGKFYQLANPDIKDEKKAEREWVKNLDKTKALRQANPSLDDALNAIMRGGGGGAGEEGAEGEGGGQAQFGKGKEGAF